MRALLAALALAGVLPARAQQDYGAKGIYPVYETAGQWVIFDKEAKPPPAGKKAPLGPGTRFLIVGDRGAELFTVARTSATYGGSCRKNKPVKLRAALLKGPRGAVGAPIIGIRVKADFKLKGSKARYVALSNEVDEGTYSRLGDAKSAVIADVKSGAFRFSLDDNPSPLLKEDPKPEQVQTKLDFGARLPVRGLKDAFVFVEVSQVSATSRRCLRLADVGPGPAGDESEGSSGAKLAGDCIEMPDKLMAETSLLRFVDYDPSGQGSPLLLAYTPSPPLWGDERWGFALRGSGPKPVVFDAMDPRCREGF
jgi:hypothetical protein